MNRVIIVVQSACHLPRSLQPKPANALLLSLYILFEPEHAPYYTYPLALYNYQNLRAEGKVIYAVMGRVRVNREAVIHIKNKFLDKIVYQIVVIITKSQKSLSRHFPAQYIL